jgi:N-acetylmuramoyl-L-alanine amidase
VNLRAPFLRVVERTPIASSRPALAVHDLISPNQDERPDGAKVDMLILHTTGTKTAAEAVGRLRDPTTKASMHYLLDQDGQVLRLVPEDRRAWHAAAAHWRGHAALDSRSLGVALVHPGSTRGNDPVPVLQRAALTDLCLLLIARHGIPARNVIAYGDAAPDRHDDPAEGFDWQAMAENGVGLWPAASPDLGTTGAVRDAAHLRAVRQALASIGYRVAPQGPLDPALSATLRAFQRHWRPEAITGQADDGTLVRLQAVQRLVSGGA